jgi:hypothetical protein
MRVLQDGLYLCSDCTQVACNGPHGIELEDAQATMDGLALLGPHLVPDFNSDTGEGLRTFDNWPCEACGTSLAGYRAQFAILGE